MHVKIISEHGYDEALFGLGLSHGVTSGMVPTDFTSDDSDMVDEHNQMGLVAERLAGKGNGHDKFLRQIMVWLDITAPRYWWPEMDQYKVATVTQSESTMHSITKHEFTREMFDTHHCCADHLNTTINVLNALRGDYINARAEARKKQLWYMIIQLLPQSYLQRRILTCSYATLRNIIDQRTGHKLSEWAFFIDTIKTQCKHSELLP